MLLKSIQSQFKTIQPQWKKEEKETKNTGEPERLFLIANANSNLLLQMQGPARGYSTLGGPVLCIFSGFWKRKQLFWRRYFFEFVKVFFLCFWWQAIISSELVFWIDTKSQLAPFWFSIEKSENLGWDFSENYLQLLRMQHHYCRCSELLELNINKG